MNIKSREKLLAGVAALSFLGISPQQTFAAQITTSQAVQQTKKITGNISDTMGPIIGATVKVKGTKKCRCHRYGRQLHSECSCRTDR